MRAGFPLALGHRPRRAPAGRERGWENSRAGENPALEFPWTVGPPLTTPLRPKGTTPRRQRKTPTLPFPQNNYPITKEVDISIKTRARSLFYIYRNKPSLK